MPLASSGNVISSSNQLGANVVTNPAMADNAIGNAEMADSAVGSAEVTNDSLMDIDINSAAGIVDTKLSEIGTASKVNGTSFKNLAGIPAGAGVIPVANLPATAGKAGNLTKDGNDTSVVQTIAHGLGHIPALAEIHLYYHATAMGGLSNNAHAWYDGTNQINLSLSGDATTQLVDTRFILSIQNSSNGNNIGVVSFDATNLYITWTKNNSTSASVYTGWWKVL